jgi:glycerol dehydrogenase
MSFWFVEPEKHRRTDIESEAIMTDPTPYLPHGLFSSPRTPRVMIAPQRYIQGDGVLDETGRYLSLVKSQRAAILISRRGQQAEGKRLLASLESAGIEPVVVTFNGECSIEEVDQQTAVLRESPQRVDCLLAVGGGKCVDAGKCIAYRLDVPLVVVSTLASNDAPCSAVSVLYTPEGVPSGLEFFPTNPAAVVVDTGIVAQAAERYLVAGMGDAMATYYEAKVCLENQDARTVIGARPTLAATALAKACSDTLYASGIAASRAVVENRVDDALERVVEANTLLSGVGFESGGLAIAHGIAQGYPAVPVVHDGYLHGEMVAMGLLTQLVAEGNPHEARRVARFFCAVGLPVNLEQISLAPDRSAELASVVELAISSALPQNMPFEVTHESLLGAVIEADRLGCEVAGAQGDAAYRRLQAG